MHPSEAKRQGGKVVGLTIPMAIRHPTFTSPRGSSSMPSPGWEEVMLLPAREEAGDPVPIHAERERLDRAAQQPGHTLRAVADWSSKVIYDVVAAENEQYRGRSVGEIAAEQGRDPFDVLCDIAVADDLLTSFGEPAPADTKEDWEARLCSLARRPCGHRRVRRRGPPRFARHVQLRHGAARICRPSSQDSLFGGGGLPHDRRAGLSSMGFGNAGRVVPGWFADLVVFDPDVVGSQEVAMRYDLPGAAGRLYADANGIDHVIVNGSPVVSGGKLTGRLMGRLLPRQRYINRFPGLRPSYGLILRDDRAAQVWRIGAT